MKKLELYWKLFISTFYISAFTFGGGYVIVPLMKKKFSDELKWIDEKEMLNMVAIAQSSPGAIAVNTSILIGYRMGGVVGALITVLGTVLPPLLIITAISFFYGLIRDNAVIGALLKGMQAGIAAVITDAVFNMGRGIIKEKSVVSVLVAVAVFVAVFFFKINVFIVIIASGLIGYIKFYFAACKKKDGETDDIS